LALAQLVVAILVAILFLYLIHLPAAVAAASLLHPVKVVRTVVQAAELQPLDLQQPQEQVSLVKAITVV
jgi:hypothetical protein